MISTLSTFKAALDRDTRIYHPKWNSFCGDNANAVIMLQAINNYWHSEWPGHEAGTKFWKFGEPCNHSMYREGDSWTEYLGIGRKAFLNARDQLGRRINIEKGETHLDAFAEGHLIAWHSSQNRLTYYYLNAPLLNEKLTNLYFPGENSLNAEKGDRDSLNAEKVFSYMPKRYLANTCNTTLEEEEYSNHLDGVKLGEIISPSRQQNNLSDGTDSKGNQQTFDSSLRQSSAPFYVEIDEGGTELADLGKEAFVKRLWDATLSAKLSGARPKLSNSQQQEVSGIYKHVCKNAEYANFVAHQIDWCKNDGSPIVGIKKLLVLLVSPDTFARWQENKNYNAIAIAGVTKGAVPLSRNGGALKPMKESSSDEFDPVWDKYIQQEND